ncbi:MAG: tetratricopeptide repeat protein [Planctomycetota bacterium]
MKLAVAFVFGLLGGVAGALLVRALEPRPQERTAAAPARTAPAADDGLAARVEKLERQLAAMPAPEAERSAPERTAARAPEGEGPGEGDAPGEAAAPEQGVAEVVQGLKGRKLVPNDTDELFEWLTNHQDKISAVIAAIQKEVAADPTNPELQVALATAYIAELWNNTPQGPQQGIVWMKAAAAYDAAIKLEPEHWTARYGKAFGESMAPEFLGMRPGAIKQFEELLEIQNRKPPEPHFASTYFRLGTLYKDAGNVEKARELWKEGLRLFPDNEELKGTIEASTKR